MTFEWFRIDDTKAQKTLVRAGNQQDFTPQFVSDYVLRITVTDPNWNTKNIFDRYITVKERDWDPKTDFTLVDGVLANRPDTDANEWFINIPKANLIHGGGGDDVFSYSNARYKIGDFKGQGEDRLDVGTNKLIWWQRLYNKDTIVVGNHETVNGYRSRKIMFELAGYTDEIDQDDFLVTDTNFIFFEVV